MSHKGRVMFYYQKKGWKFGKIKDNLGRLDQRLNLMIHRFKRLSILHHPSGLEVPQPPLTSPLPTGQRWEECRWTLLAL